MTFTTQATPSQRELARDLENDVQFTHHAIEQMANRNIPRPAVLAVIMNGRWVPNHENELIHFMGWCVVMDDNKVVTAFYRKQWGKYELN